MLLNVFFPHIPATLVFRDYTPGLISAVLINFPLMIILLRKARKERLVSRTESDRVCFLRAARDGRGHLDVLHPWLSGRARGRIQVWNVR